MDAVNISKAICLGDHSANSHQTTRLPWLTTPFLKPWEQGWADRSQTMVILCIICKPMILL